MGDRQITFFQLKHWIIIQLYLDIYPDKYPAISGYLSINWIFIQK